MELRDLIGPAKSADSAVRGRWRCRLYHSGRAYFATVATADHHGTVAHRHVDHAGTMCADHVAQFRSSQGNRRHRFGHHPADFAYRRHGCYLAYYHLPPMPAFIDGTTPLIAVTVFSEIVVTMIV